MAKRKTVSVEWLRERINRALAVDAPCQAIRDMTPEEAYRTAMSLVIEDVLFETGNYNGFSYNHVTRYDDGRAPDIHDETKRAYL